MQTIGLAEISDWLGRESKQESVMLTGGTAIPTRGDVYLLAFGLLVSLFGEPDHPGDIDMDWRVVLGVPTGLLAVWDFDYYQLSLVADDLQGEGAVVLTRHVVSH